MSTSLGSKQKLIYAIIITIGLLYGVYALFISTTLKEINTTQESCVKLQSELKELEPYENNKAVYLRQIDENNAEIAERVDRFLPDISHKDFIAYSQDLYSNYHDNVLILTFKEPEIIEDINYTFDNERNNIKLIKREASATYEVNYADLKEFLEFFKDSDLKLEMKEFNASLDTNINKLTGSMTFTARAIEGSNKEDTTYSTREIATGIGNIFGEYSESELEVD